MQNVFPIKEINQEDEEYPVFLKKIPDPPKKLYIRGKLFAKEKCFAIVGSRAFSNNGKQFAFKIAKELNSAGLTIISGLAEGIDTFSHEAVVKENQRTIAVLGTGLDEKSIYPKSNISLSRRILEKGGCLISELPPGTRGSKTTFPERNRIISGMSIGVLVVEAKIKSGSLITASFAFSHKRKVFTIPSLNAESSHYLSKRGAKLINNTKEILKELKI